MTDTSKDVERFHLNTSMGDMVRCKSGCFVSYADYAAISAQLEAADMPITTAQIMADERVKALVDASTQFAKAFLNHDDGCGKNFHLTWKERSEAFAKLTHTLAQLKEPKQ